MEDERPVETPLEEQMKNDLDHYEKASSAIHSWHSGIPRAIRFYYEDRVEIMKELEELENKIIELNETPCRHCGDV